MRVFECFSPNSPELRLTDLSARLGISKAHALRIATTLESSGYLARDPETKRFRLGIGLFRLGMLVSQQMDLRRLAHPHLQRLVEATHETARLVVPDDAGPICIDLVESPRGIRVFAQLGMRMPWNAGSSPKLLLAYLPEDQRERILARAPFKAFTDRTTTDADALRQEVLAIRARGVHVGVGDLDVDAAGVSGPIFNHKGHIVGSVNVSAPISRLVEDEVARFVVLVSESCAAISVQLGYTPEPAGHVAD
jgi:DNA-binding IclR family transcriptional regulator